VPLDEDGLAVRQLMHMTRKCSVRLFSAGVLVAGGIGVPVLLGAESAQASTCNTATAAGESCALTGSAVLGGGDLILTTPASLAWAGSVTGVDQALVDTAPADQTYVVNDATGSGAGWDVTVAATTFTTATTPALTLPDSGTFQTNGDVAAPPAGEADTAAPTAACSTGSACTLPDNTTVFPVLITTATALATPYTIYNAAAATAAGITPVIAPNGLGSIVIGGSAAPNPVGWWLNVPANTLAGTYTSTITLAIVTAP
jgi:hypothetical protein